MDSLPAALTIVDLAERYWPVALISFVMALVATPTCRAFARKKNIVDRPDDWLKPHKQPTALLGGVAIFLAWVACLLLALPYENLVSNRLLVFLVAGAGITLLGLFDDLRVMQPRAKLLGNLVVGAWLIYWGLGGDALRSITDFMRIEYETPADRALLAVYSIPLALFVIVGACNATNLIDGIDGLCSGVLGIISVGFLLLAAHLALYKASGQLTANDHERIVLSLAMLGAALGFLPYNRNPATIFMGDTGSMLLGLNAAMLILLFAEAHMTRWLIGALMVFGLPVGDMLLTLVRRWRNEKPIMEGDRSHFYDQLIDRGWTVRQVVALSYILATLFVVVGCSVIFLRTRYAILIYMVMVAGGALAVGKLKMVQLERPAERGTPTHRPDTDSSQQA